MAYQPQYGGGYNQQPQYGQPQYGQPQYGSGYQQQPPPPQPQPQYGAPQYGAPPAPAPTGYGGPVYGQPQQPSYGVPPQAHNVMPPPAAPQQPGPPPPQGYPGHPGPPPPGPGAPPPTGYNPHPGMPPQQKLQQQQPPRQQQAPQQKPKPPPERKSFAPLPQTKGHGTIHITNRFSAEADARALYDIINKGGSDKDSIINVVAYRSTKQRQEIRTMFKTMYGKDIVDQLDSVLSGKFQRVVLALMRDDAERDAHILFKGMKGMGYDEDCLLEILVSRDGEQIDAIKKAFQRMYGRSLESAIEEEAAGKFKRLLIGLAQGNRSSWEKDVDMEKMRRDAKALYDAGEGKWGTETSEFRRLLCVRSIPELRYIFQEYNKICKRTLEQSCKKEMSGNLLTGMKTIIRFVEDPPKFFARVLYKSMKGLGTDDRKLTRTIVTRCDVDMVEIKRAFEQDYGKPLARMIRGDCSGAYLRILLVLIGEA